MSGETTSGICKMCKQRPGTKNSKYEFAGAIKVGIWICDECEAQEESEYKEWMSDWSDDDLPF